MVGGVDAAPAVFPWPEEEEESDPGQVDDCLLAVGAALVGGVQGLEDGDGGGADACRWGVLPGVCGELLAQPKVDIAQLVVTGVAGPHGCEIFSQWNEGIVPLTSSLWVFLCLTEGRRAHARRIYAGKVWYPRCLGGWLVSQATCRICSRRWSLFGRLWQRRHVTALDVQYGSQPPPAP